MTSVRYGFDQKKLQKVQKQTGTPVGRPSSTCRRLRARYGGQGGARTGSVKGTFFPKEAICLSVRQRANCPLIYGSRFSSRSGFRSWDPEPDSRQGRRQGVLPQGSEAARRATHDYARRIRAKPFSVACYGHAERVQLLLGEPGEDPVMCLFE
jgi:hypothetical protein